VKNFNDLEKLGLSNQTSQQANNPIKTPNRITRALFKGIYNT